jgi:hypothetical protein
MESKAMPSLDRALEMLRDCRQLSEAEQQSIIDAIANSQPKPAVAQRPGQTDRPKS